MTQEKLTGDDRNGELFFADATALADFEYALIDRFPKWSRCVNELGNACQVIRRTAADLAEAVDRQELTESGAVDQAEGEWRGIARDCHYGLSGRTKRCGRAVLCSMDWSEQ